MGESEGARLIYRSRGSGDFDPLGLSRLKHSQRFVFGVSRMKGLSSGLLSSLAAVLIGSRLRSTNNENGGEPAAEQCQQSAANWNCAKYKGFEVPFINSLL